MRISEGYLRFGSRVFFDGKPNWDKLQSLASLSKRPRSGNSKICETKQRWLRTVLIIATICGIGYLLSYFRPKANNYLMIVNESGAQFAEPISFAFMHDHDPAARLFYRKVHIREFPNSITIWPINDAFFSGKIIFRDANNVQLMVSDFDPPGRYNHCAVIQIRLDKGEAKIGRVYFDEIRDLHREEKVSGLNGN